MLENLIGVCTYLFYGYICLVCLNYIMKSLFFIRPMASCYKIMAPDLSNDIRGRYPYILFSVGLILFFMKLTYYINIYLFIIFFCIYIIDIVFLFSKYDDFGLLEYINEFSADLFDWEKIYNLYVSEDLKRQCFKIHYLDYDEFEKQYLQKLINKQIQIQNKKI